MPSSMSLPDWLVAELPPVKPHGRVDADGPSAVVYRAPDGRTTSFDNVESAYGALWQLDLELGDALLEREDALAGRMITFPSERNGYVTSWMTHNDALHVERLESDYRESLAFAEAYRSERSDFLAAYRYVDTHPAFWFRRGGPESWYWETSGHVNRVQLMVWPDDDGLPVVYLDTGSHTPDMAEHYYDPYLHGEGRTFEEAVVMLACNVAIKFNDDGSETGEKPPNPYADDLMATLKERNRKLDTQSRPVDMS